MTWSIVAHDPDTGQIGIAVSTCAFAVGARVPFVETGVGAVATQSFVNPFYGPRGLQLMREGIPVEEVIRRLTEADEGRSQRQVHVMDATGHFAAYTGEGCVPWCGHLIRDTFSVAGNMLAGPRVIEATLAAFGSRRDLPFAERLMAALDAGQAEGGDKRGRQSAALKIWRTEPYPALDLRVDDHPEPLAELRRLYGVAHERFLAFMDAVATRTNPAGVTDRAWIDQRAREIQERAPR